MKYDLPGRYKTLSYSGMTTFLNCPKKYAYQYIDKVPVDYVPALAMDRGSAFHLLAEHQGRVEQAELLEICGGNIFEVIKVKAAYKKYHLAALSLPKMQHREVVIKSEEHQYYGVVDSIGVQDDGRWMLGEMKTTTKLDALRWGTLQVNTQIALYTAFSGEFAHENFLSMQDMVGVSYRVVTMSGKRRLGPTKTKKRPSAETEDEFAERIKDDSQTYHQMVVTTDEARRSALHSFGVVKEAIHNLDGDSGKAVKNTSNCFAYGRPCDFFEHCHKIKPQLDEQTLDIEDDMSAEI